MDEEEIWKCPKHPSKRRRTGICHVCLRDRLSTLCPDCANARPCPCFAATATQTTSSSSSSSSSFSRFSSHDVVGGGPGPGPGPGPVGRVSNLIESEPAFRRSRSVAIPFLRSRSRFVETGSDTEFRDSTPKAKASSFWSVFRSSKKVEEVNDNLSSSTMMRRSRSVAVSMTSDSGKTKGWSWYFPSPIKVFRQSKISKVVHERSPLYRGWFLFFFFFSFLTFLFCTLSISILLKI